MSVQTETQTALAIQIKGEIVKSNFDVWSAELKEQIRALNYELSTDADFDAAAKNVKSLKGAEEALEESKEEALKQAEDIQKLFAAIDDVSAVAREARLKLDRQIKERKATRAKEIVEDAVNSIKAILKDGYRPQIEAAIKGRRTIDTIKWAANDVVESVNAQIVATRQAMEEMIAENPEASVLMPDQEKLEQMKRSDLLVEMSRRFERANLAKETAKLKAQQEKLEADAAALRATQAKELAAAQEQNRAGDESKSTSTVVEEKATSRTHAPAPLVGDSVTISSTARSVTIPRNASEEEMGSAAQRLGPTVAEEMADFKERLKLAFAPLKVARGNLKHHRNIELAQVFADKLMEGWKLLDGGGAE